MPAGDTTADQLVRSFCATVEFGSAQLIKLKQEPAVLVISLLVVLGIISALLGRTDWSEVAPLPIVRRRRAGQIIGAARRFWSGRLVRFVPAGVVYLGASIVVGILVGIIGSAPLVDTLLSTDRNIGAVGILVSATVVGLAYAMSIGIVVAIVSLQLQSIDDGAEITGWQAARLAGERLGALLTTLLRAVAITVGLIITVVGIPWAFRQLIRYQFVAQVVVLEDRRGKDALRRSSELSRGRWWHTAAVIALVTLLVFVVGSVAGLLLLIVLSGVPLWLFSALVTVASALLVPFVAITYVLLYGDARAEHAGAPPAEPVVADDPVRQEVAVAG